MCVKKEKKKTYGIKSNNEIPDFIKYLWQNNYLLYLQNRGFLNTFNRF